MFSPTLQIHTQTRALVCPSSNIIVCVYIYMICKWYDQVFPGIFKHNLFTKIWLQPNLLAPDLLPSCM